MTRNEIMEILNMPEADFRRDIMPLAYDAFLSQGGTLLTTPMLGYSNICKNHCLYCGMRADNKIPRYRISPEDAIETVRLAKDQGYSRIFLISGEDPKYGYENLLRMTSEMAQMGLYVSLACGEYEPQQYAELAAAGAKEYVVKFEMSQPEVFDRLNPSTNFTQRMKTIEAVKKSGMALGSGNIVGYPGQTLTMIAEDIELMQKLEISWAPNIPYMPAAGTPLALEGGPGDIITTLKELSILRLTIPGVKITAQQPGKDLSKGLADPEGNLDAIHAGANVLFCDLLPDAQAQSFRVIDNRNITGSGHIDNIAKLSGLPISK